MSNLYEILTRYGLYYKLNLSIDLNSFFEKLSLFDNYWVQYNPRKKIERYGISLTSLDGSMSGYPDLDSVKEYNELNNLQLEETDFKEKTMAWDLVSDCLDVFDPDIGRTHIIKQPFGGMFPPHRDEYSRDIISFRLFIPIKKCNPPNNYFILDERILNFDHGYVYFIDTCKEHTVFTTLNESIFVVVNVGLTEKSVDTVLSNLSIS
jgi:hypothetical protein